MNRSKLELVVSSDVGKLLESAADGFLRPLRATPDNPFPSPDYLLALRQGGLRDDLIRLAASRGCKGWFDPPLCIFNELPRWLGKPNTRVLTDVERIALLANVVRRVGGAVFGQSGRLDCYLDSLDSFFGELVSEGLSPPEFDAATASLFGEKGSFNARKNLELTKIYRAYVAALDAAGARDGRDSLVAAADIIAKDGVGFAARLGGRKEIRFYGLADLRGGWKRLLSVLAECPSILSVRVYSTREFSPSELKGLPPFEVRHLTAETNIAASLFRTVATIDREPAHGRFTVIEAPNTERELGEVALEVRRLVDDGVPIHRIAIVTRQGRPYVELVVRALRCVGVPATARLRVAFNEIPVVKAVLSLFAGAANGWTRQSLTEIAGFPYFVPLLEPAVLNSIGFRRSVRGLPAWQAAIEELRRETERISEPTRDENHGPKARLSVATVEDALCKFVKFKELLSDLDGKRTLFEWLEWLERFLSEDRLDVGRRVYSAAGSDYEPVRRDIAGWRGLQTISTEWKKAVANWGDAATPDSADAPRISVADFSKRLREMLDGQVGIRTETQRGVQVMEALAAAYREFDFLFLCGMEAGSFPLPAPRSPILDDDDRATIGTFGFHLDTGADWDFRERDLFRTVVSGARNLTVSYPAIGIRGAESIRSAFVEALAANAGEARRPVDEYAVITPGMPVVSSANGRALADHAASVECERLTGVESRFSGRIEDEELRDWLRVAFDDNKLWSPSQIEAYAKCPWAYFSGYLLGVEKFEEPDEDMQATIRGSLLHAALARFYDAVADEIGRPAFLRSGDLEWAEKLMARTLDAVFDGIQERAWTGHPALRDVKRAELKRELCRYLAWEVEFHDRMDDHKKSDALILRTGAAAHELSFGESGAVVLERKGIRFKFRGTIDRVDEGIDPRIENPSRFVAAIDYKSSIGGVPGGGKGAAWNEGVVLQVPLYAYALTRIRDDVDVSRVEYRPLRETRPGASPGTARPHCLQLYQVDKKTGVLRRNEDDAAKMERALDAVCDHVIKAKNGYFPVSPAPSCGCPAYCHAYDICRVPPQIREGQHR